MDIRTIEIQEAGSFLVNKNVDKNDDRQLCIPDDMSNPYRVMIQEWIDAGNIPDPFVKE